MLKARILLIILLCFLITPLVATTGGSKSSVSFFFSMNEEENQTHSQNKLQFYPYNSAMHNLFAESEYLNLRNFTYQINEDYGVALNTLSPPPEV